MILRVFREDLNYLILLEWLHHEQFNLVPSTRFLRICECGSREDVRIESLNSPFYSLHFYLEKKEEQETFCKRAYLYKINCSQQIVQHLSISYTEWLNLLSSHVKIDIFLFVGMCVSVCLLVIIHFYSSSLLLQIFICLTQLRYRSSLCC